MPTAKCEMRLLAGLSCLLSVGAFAYYFSRDEILLYGDAVAHINIARRLFDSRTPGLLQLGTVWLPLPHLTAAPLLLSEWAWRSGAGGALVSMAAYVAGAIGIFRLVRDGLARLDAETGPARLAAWLAAVVYAANPNLLYLQATAMTESLSLALLIWATVFLAEYAAQLRESEIDAARPRRSLIRCGLVLAAGMLTRYDFWFAGAAFGVAAFAAVLAHVHSAGCPWWRIPDSWRRPLAAFVLIGAAGPLLWLAYNSQAYGNPLEFATGPYSARAIEARSAHAGSPHYPGWQSPAVAASYFVKSAKLNLGEWRSNSTWFPVAVLGVLLLLLRAGSLWPWLLLWAPLPFYALSIAYGGVPIFLPVWWPFSYYNVRYGIQLLPAVAVFIAVAFYFGLTWMRSPRWRWGLTAAAFSLVVVAYVQASLAVPVSLREAQVNSRARVVLERALAYRLKQLPSSATFLMYVGEHSGALQRAGIPFRRTMNEGNKPEFNWSLITPGADADYVIGAAGDPVAAAVAANSRGLTRVSSLSAPGQGTVVIYRSDRRRR